MRAFGLILCLLVICHFSFAQAKEYDGIWFLGFNVQRPPFDNLVVRQAVAHALTKDTADESSVGSLIPPGMTGFDPALKPWKYNVKFAKSLLKKAGYNLTDSRLKSITLLHTDGIKTVEVAKKIQTDLKQLGLKIELVEIPYKDEEKWSRQLSARKNNLFLMGYKAGGDLAFTEEASSIKADAYQLLDPLFRTGGDVNFTGYSNSAVDLLLDKTAVFSVERESKLKEINRIVYKELPVLVLFYIEKL
ncbi:MAG: ABC transporter substrate-binding protein [Candidatus Margulisbacteria bacterium]|nr:ABC transporter substrate-binding protein [Candidatus Margulisiibacteriota bacterium]